MSWSRRSARDMEGSFFHSPYDYSGLALGRACRCPPERNSRATRCFVTGSLPGPNFLESAPFSVISEASSSSCAGPRWRTLFPWAAAHSSPAIAGLVGPVETSTRDLSAALVRAARMTGWELTVRAPMSACPSRCSDAAAGMTAKVWMSGMQRKEGHGGENSVGDVTDIRPQWSPVYAVLRMCLPDRNPILERVLQSDASPPAQIDAAPLRDPTT